MTKQKRSAMDAHYFDTANFDNYVRCKNACDKFGLKMVYENRPTCIKQHHYVVYAYTVEQCDILTLMILACTAHAEQDKWKKILAEKVAKGDL